MVKRGRETGEEERNGESKMGGRGEVKRGSPAFIHGAGRVVIRSVPRNISRFLRFYLLMHARETLN